METTTINGHPTTFDRRQSDKLIEAKTIIPLGFDRYELRVSTCKTMRGGVACHASVMQVSEDGRSVTHRMFGDFSMRLDEDRHCSATRNNIELIHRRGMAQIDRILVLAKEHTKKFVVKETA